MSEHSTSNGDFSEVPHISLTGSILSAYSGFDQTRLDNSSLVMDEPSYEVVSDEPRYGEEI